MDFIVAFFLGFVVSFVGSIPPAGINLTAIRIALEKTKVQALWFSAGAVLIEGIFMIISLQFASYVAAHAHWEFWIKWTAVVVFLVLGIAAFWPVVPKTDNANEKKSIWASDFVYGMFLSVINPLQIPFWLAYGTYFYTNQWLDAALTPTLVFVVGAMLGTYLLLYIYAVYASTVLARIMKDTLSGKRLIGFVFLGLALLQLGQNVWELYTKGQ
jgi:threonine/homoserine/homoserine lactone efflux protein